jgi:hypothetical protein
MDKMAKSGGEKAFTRFATLDDVMLEEFLSLVDIFGQDNSGIPTS